MKMDNWSTLRQRLVEIYIGEIACKQEIQHVHNVLKEIERLNALALDPFDRALKLLNEYNNSGFESLQDDYKLIFSIKDCFENRISEERRWSMLKFYLKLNLKENYEHNDPELIPYLESTLKLMDNLEMEVNNH